MASPMRGTVEAARTASAAGMSACEKSRLNMAAAASRTTNVRASPYPIANRQMPNRWVMRRIGAMNVYSIVPSHRSQLIA
jgi:hypothetical protein